MQSIRGGGRNVSLVYTRAETEHPHIDDSTAHDLLSTHGPSGQVPEYSSLLYPCLRAWRNGNIIS